MNGHYSREQWQAFVQGKAAEPEQMLAHLTACEECMELYTALLMQADIPAPPRGMTEEILSRIQPQKTQVVFLPQLLRVLLSATLAIIVWVGTSAFIAPDANLQKAEARAQQQTEWMDKQIEKERRRAIEYKPLSWDWKTIFTEKEGE